MNKTLKFLPALCCLFFLCGCFGKLSTEEMKLTAPQNNSIPFKGTWQIVKCINKGFVSASKDSGDIWVGKKAEFLKDGVKVGDDIWKNPSYKIKAVDAKVYFLYKYGVSSQELSIKDNLAEVITITSGDKFLYEFIKLNDNEGIFSIQDKIFSLTKVSDNIESNFTEELKTKKSEGNSNFTDSEEEIPSSGVLLGIRYNKTGMTFGYKTLWIASKNKVLYPVLETQNIFLPRMNGFWKLEPERFTDGSRVEDIIKVCSPSQLKINETGEVKMDLDKWGTKEGSISRKILYIGNDYISMEITGKGNYTDNTGTWEERQLQVKPIDNITGDKNVKLSDLVGINGLKTLEEAKVSAAKYINNLGKEKISKEFIDENFYLQRRTGHWIFKGRINHEKDVKKTAYDFNINIIPPKNLVSFDILCISWNKIKDKVPDAIDAYTSPNKDMAVILSSTKIYIYSIEDGKLCEKPLAKIKLAESDSVVMAEWATGWYVDKWEECFMRNDVKRVMVN